MRVVVELQSKGLKIYQSRLSHCQQQNCTKLNALKALVRPKRVWTREDLLSTGPQRAPTTMNVINVEQGK